LFFGAPSAEGGIVASVGPVDLDEDGVPDDVEPCFCLGTVPQAPCPPSDAASNSSAHAWRRSGGWAGWTIVGRQSTS